MNLTPKTWHGCRPLQPTVPLIILKGPSNAVEGPLWKGGNINGPIFVILPQIVLALQIRLPRISANFYPHGHDPAVIDSRPGSRRPTEPSVVSNTATEVILRRDTIIRR